MTISYNWAKWLDSVGANPRSIKHPSTYEEKSVTNDCKKCEIAEHDATVERYRLKKEAEILAEVPAKLAEYKKDYDEQVAGFKFKCQRWGQFLNVYVAFGESEYETSLNMGNVKRIDLIDGHEVDASGEVYYYVSECLNSEKGNRDLSFINKRFANRYYQITGLGLPQFETKECSIKSSYDPWGCGISNGVLPNKTSGAARYFKNDKISFNGIDYDLEVPFGLGRDIRDKIIKAKDTRK